MPLLAAFVMSKCIQIKRIWIGLRKQERISGNQPELDGVRIIFDAKTFKLPFETSGSIASV